MCVCKADSFHLCWGPGFLVVSAEADSAHGAHTVVLAAPVREIVVVPFLQDVMRSSVVGLLIHHPPTNKGRGVSCFRCCTTDVCFVTDRWISQIRWDVTLTLPRARGWRRLCWGCSGSTGWGYRPGSPSSYRRIQHAQTAELWLGCCPKQED